MGKSYVENSLKRFLKRKVKITLGLVVTFMITGAVSFGVNIENHENITVDKGTALKVENNDIFTNYGNLETKDRTKGIIGLEVTGNGVLYNYGNIITPKGKAIQTSNKEVHNYGILEGTWNVLTTTNKEEVKIYNHESGKVIGTQNIISSLFGSKKLSIYNNGEINSENYFAFNGGGILELYNYGTLKTKDTSYILGNNIKENKTYLKNYGKVLGGQVRLAHFVQVPSTINLFELDNYGFINAKGGISLRILIEQDNPEENIKNYGFINAKGGIDVQGKQSKTSLLNKGVIEGSVIESIPGSIEGKKAINNSGIIIAKNENMNNFLWASLNNKGAVLQKQTDGTYELLNSDTQTNATIKTHGVVKDMSDKAEINTETIKTNGKEMNNLFINNKSLKLNLGETIKDKVITAVSQTKGNVVLDNNNKEGDENLTLDNTTIVGYFEEDGTLLKADGDLTLGNNSIINAVAKRDDNGNILAEAVAVDVKGSLTYTEGENHIFGIIKGGENSEITVKPEENIPEGESSSLNEDIKTSGQLTLEGEEWTKGQGSITLEGDNAEVNIGKDGTGTLTGYLFGDSKDGKTTLDGMIDGTGTLNMGRMRFNLGNLDIGGLEDTFTIEGSDGKIKVEDVINKIDVSGIFKKEIKDGDLVLSLKSAEEMGIYDPAKQKEYEELVKNFKDSEDIYTLINTGDAEAIRNHLKVIDAILELLGTSGVKITRDLTGAFTDAVVEFDKKADKGQWLTNAKYIGSDMEYDGTKNINGYDSDIKSMVGMAEYGITENTSLGFALGGGDTEIDLKTLNGKSTSFDGNNYYAGIYAKHSMNGFDMTGSLGYTISELDVEKGGSADSKAFTLAGYVKRDVKLTDTVKLEPNVSFIYDYIMQDKAEMGEGMTIDSGDYHVFEAGAGLNLVKEFAFEKGSLKLKTGVKYSMINVERNQEVTGRFYNADVNLGSPDIDDKYGKAHAGFDYEHVSGFGVNGKYETMWSNSGDDSRVTAGISYRF